MPHQLSTSVGVAPTVLEPGPLPRAARAALALIATLSGLAVVGIMTAPDPSFIAIRLLREDGFYLILATGHGVCSTLILRRLPSNPVGRLLLLSALTATAAFTALTLKRVPLFQWFSGWLPLVPLLLLPMPLLVFPSGPPTARWWRSASLLALALVVVPTTMLAVAAALDPQPVDEWGMNTAYTPRPVAELLVRVGLWTAFALFVVTTVLGIVILSIRRRQTRDEHARGQLRVLAYGLATIIPAIVLETQYPGAWLLAAVSVPTAMTIAIVAHGLYDIDLFINRSAVYGILTLVVFAVYSAVIEVLRHIFSAAFGQGSLVATGVIAAMFLPIRERVQSAVNRLLYGDRDNPYVVLTRLSQQLQGVLDPDSVLAGIVDTVTTALRVPYAEIRVSRDDSLVTAVQTGRLVGEPAIFPMRLGGVLIGQLIVAPRTSGQRFTDAEHQLLSDLASRAAGAVQTVVAVQNAKARA